MDDHESLTRPLTASAAAAQGSLDTFERIAMAGPMPEPMRTQLAHAIAVVVEATIERAVRETVERVLAATLTPPTEIAPSNALEPTPLQDGSPLAVSLGLDSEGGLTIGG